jgi:hypothetical protein
MTPFPRLLPSLPGIAAPSYASWPVWAGSVAKPIRFAPMAKRAAVKLWHRARGFDRATHEPGQHGGAVGHAALQVLHALIFDFLNHRTGRLDPSYAAIARKANVCVRTVASALKRLRELGILDWVRRCAESWRDGRFVREQETNAYGLQPESQWRGYRAPPEPPAAPWPDTWGATPPLPSALALAALEGSVASKVHALASDPKDGLAAALARLGRAFMARNP